MTHPATVNAQAPSWAARRVKQSLARRSAIRRWFGRIAVLLGLLLLLPYAVAPLYRVIDPISTPMLWRMLRGARVEQIRVPIGQIAPVLPLTVIVAEDARFCGHSGIDWQGIKDAIGNAYDGDKLRGGSSIPQSQESVPVAGSQLRAQAA